MGWGFGVIALACCFCGWVICLVRLLVVVGYLMCGFIGALWGWFGLIVV